MPPVLTPSAIATMEPMPSCPGSGSMAAQKSSLMSLRPASDAKPMSRSNAMHQDKQVSCLILVHRSKPPGKQAPVPQPGSSGTKLAHQHLHAALVLRGQLLKEIEQLFAGAGQAL